MNSRRLAVTLVAASLMSIFGSAQATTYQFNFSGTGAITSQYAGPFNGGPDFITDSQSNLTTTAGATTIPSFTLQSGDVVTGVVDLSSAFTVPEGSLGGSLLVYLGGCCFSGVVLANESMSLSNHGVAVSNPFDASYNGSSSPLAVGTFSTYGAPTPSFSFDHLSYSFTVTGFNNAGSTSVLIPGGGMYLDSRVMSAVPEPATAILLAGGLAAVWGLRRRGNSVVRLAN